MFIQGSLSLLSAASLIQIFCQEQRSVQMLVRHKEQTALLTIAEGMIVAAHCDQVRGPEAVYRMVSWPDGLFHVKPLELPPALIEMEGSWEELLLEAARRRDEASANL
jgi:hypothetical protein